MDESEQEQENNCTNGTPKPKPEDGEKGVSGGSAGAGVVEEKETGKGSVEGMEEEEVVEDFTVTFNRVLTKVQDGGSKVEGDTTDGQQANDDAFQRYSNTNVRMTHLLGLDEDNQGKNKHTMQVIFCVVQS